MLRENLYWKTEKQKEKIFFAHFVCSDTYRAQVGHKKQT